MVTPVLEVEGLRKTFPAKDGGEHVAVECATFNVMPGECVGLVGGSGSGKSTIAGMITRLVEPTAGTVRLVGCDITHARGAQQRALARDVQMVFQNPASSFDPRRTLGDGIAEGLRNFGMDKHRAAARTVDLLVRCGLPEEFANRYPREVSGGQCQRAAIARALAANPALIICDEATSALDVTVQAQIVELLHDLARDHATAYLFICHDLALVQGFCDRVLVMQQGRIVEEGPTELIIASPNHPYTRKLLDATLPA